MSEFAYMPLSDYEDACDAIRAKTGESGLIKSGDMAAAIGSIETGGGSGDYELVDTYSVTEPVTQLSMTIPEWATAAIIIFSTQDSVSNKSALYHTLVAQSRKIADVNTSATHGGRFTVIWIEPDSNNFGGVGTAGWFVSDGSSGNNGTGYAIEYSKPGNVLYVAGSSATFTGTFTLYARR